MWPALPMWTRRLPVGFDNGEKYNEISYAKELSELIPVKNYSKTITPEEFWGNFGKIQYHMDEPLADPSAVALYFVCNTASKYLKVVMSGEGADEIFGGYNIYKEPLAVPAYDKIPFPIRRFIGKIASHLPKKSGINFLIRRGKKLEDRFIGNAYMFTEEERKKLLKIKTDAPSPAEVVKPFYDRVKDKDPVTKMQFVDLNAWMVGDILLKADKMSMANSLEVRVPFLDKKIMELAERIPLKYRVNDENTKFAMRKAALRRMPEKWAGKREARLPRADTCVAQGRQVLQHRKGEVHGRSGTEILQHRHARKAAGRPQKRQGGQQPPRLDGLHVPRVVRPVL